jgi:hypothetical protein
MSIKLERKELAERLQRLEAVDPKIFSNHPNEREIDRHCEKFQSFVPAR